MFIKIIDIGYHIITIISTIMAYQFVFKKIKSLTEGTISI